MQSFGAYGQRRGTNWTGSPTSTDLATINGTTRKGFTEHEMLDSTELVHMNGRVFDPAIGRFVSADPVEGCGRNTQDANRFAYVRNLPLIATDPTGFWPFYCFRPYDEGWYAFFDQCIDLGNGSLIYGGFAGIVVVVAPVPQSPPMVDWTPVGVPPSKIPGPPPNPPTDPRDGCGEPGAPLLSGDGTFDLTPACIMHDRCYRRCQVS
jgi:RHS repeat-associated protein